MAMETSNSSVPDKKNIAFANSEYFRIRKAAEMLGCEAEDLLHLGAVGNAQIMAPVLTEAQFELTGETVGLTYLEIDLPFRAVFGPEHRVILSRMDLARIEATGWAVPYEFACPSRTQKYIEHWETFSGEEDHEASDRATSEMRSRVVAMLESQLAAITEETLAERGYDGSLSVDQARASAREAFERDVAAADENGSFRVHSFRTHVKPDPKSDEGMLQAMALYDPWRLAEPMPDDAPKTTIAHLFLSRTEVERLEKGLPQEGVAQALKNQDKKERTVPHGNSERFANRREQILAAAIYCKERWPDRCSKVADWVRCLEQNASVFWSRSEQPPSAPDTIARLLSSALKPQDFENKTAN